MKNTISSWFSEFERNNRLVFLGGIVLVAILFLIIDSSPLLYTNTWVDTNAMLTVGRSILEGELPFRDIFEQRGPVFYALYAVAAAISSTNFLGVFVIEILAMLLTYYAFTRISRLYFKDSRIGVLMAVVAEIIVITSTSMQQGGSPEEIIAPAIAGASYMVLKSGFNLNRIESFVLALLMGIVFWIKYSLIGMWIIYYIALIVYMVAKKEWKKLIQVVTCSLAGVVVISLPVILVFLYNHALQDLINEYFLANITGYSSSASSSVIAKILGTIKPNVVRHVLLGMVFIALLLFELILVKNKKAKLESLNIVILLAMLVGEYLLMNIGGRTYDYYFLPVVVLMAVIILRGIKNIQISSNVLSGVLVSSVGLMFCGSLFGVPYFTDQFFETNVRAGKVFNELILQKQEKKSLKNVLQFGGIDNGMYLATGKIVPKKYFNNPNFTYEQNPSILDSQMKYIKNKEVEFVITTPLNDEVLAYYKSFPDKATQIKNAYFPVPKVLTENYTLVKRVAADSAIDGEYMLFQKKP